MEMPVLRDLCEMSDPFGKLRFMASSNDKDVEAEPDELPDVEPDVGQDADPDQAWRALGLINDWIKHAEAKVGATLASSGVAGVMLYNLVKEQSDPGVWLSAVAVACTAAIIAAGSAAAMALVPRVSIVSRRRTREAQNPPITRGDGPAAVPEDPVNLLFFSNIARHYEGDGPSYVQVLRSLTADREALTQQIAHQVHANAIVAHRKFAWADRAIKFLVVALVLLGALAMIIGLKGG
ncbi:Pycsar system effector family protein [Jiangella rhizosphaerae]|uniref:Pycsar effector protein domain-containing protein n=1 Tax=Jiangella rhizosphaerae TaxID=2293569 RepID=A0A418KPK8_9ACTN|nr:Pycsar system effector family protein [Jiangella rhizosphaerae]RIQ21052.1 hypothetical protein DY240_15985 [Jiangella rhizosphaerae]